MKYITILLMILYCVAVKSQSADVYFNCLFGNMNNKTFNTFSSSYNEYQTLQNYPMQKPLSGIKRSMGYSLGARIAFVSVNYLWIQGTSKCVFENGQIRNFKLTYSTPLNIGFPFLIKRKLLIHPKLGIAKTFLTSTYEYIDGTISRGNETLFTGQYYATTFYFGLDVSFRKTLAKYHAIELGATMNWFNGSTREPISDMSRGRHTSVAIDYPSELPLNVSDYFDKGSYNYNYTRQGYVIASAQAYYIYLTYSFGLHKKDEEEKEGKHAD